MSDSRLLLAKHVKKQSTLCALYQRFGTRPSIHWASLHVIILPSRDKIFLQHLTKPLDLRFKSAL